MIARRLGALSLALAFAAASSSPAGAQETFFGEDTDGSESTRSSNVNSANAESLFLANLVGVGTEGFDGLTAGTTNPTLAFPGAGSATLSGAGQVVELTCSASDPDCTNGFGRYPVSSPNYWEATASGSSTDAFTINFTDPVAAFGFYGNDIGDFGGQLSLSFLSGSSSFDVPVPHTVITDNFGGENGGNLFYFGYIDVANPFTQVTFEFFDASGSAADVFGFDDMTIGSVEQVVSVPEPASAGLLVTGLLGLVGVARRRRNED